MFIARSSFLATLTLFGLLILAAPSEATANGEVTAVELFRLPEPCTGIYASYPDHGFCGIVTSGSGLYRFKANGQHELLRRMEQPTGLVQHSTGRLLVADAAKPGVFFVSRTPTTNRFRGTSITSGTEGRPLQSPMWLLQELRHVSSNGKNTETTLAFGNMYLSDLGSGAADKPSGLIFRLEPNGVSPTRYETRVVADGLASPHGMALSKDGNVLYVAEQDTNRILAFRVTELGQLGEPKLLAELPRRDANDRLVDSRPAGLCLDDAGHIYVAHCGMGLIQVLDPTGRLLRTYDAGMRWPTGVAFGDREDRRPADRYGRRLYVAGRTGNKHNPEGVVVRLELDVKGLRMLPDSF